MKSGYLTRSELEKFYNHPGILHKFKDDLVIFNYNHECQYDRLWDEYSLQARGLIVNRNTGRIVARPFPKFFNLNETPETTLGNLPEEPFTATVKWDGVLGILYYHKNRYNIATRGSFDSQWAIWATNWINSPNNFNLSGINPKYTYLFEIISPESRIVVDYEGKEALVLLGVVDIETAVEQPYPVLVEAANVLGVEHTKSVPFNNIYEMIEKSKIIPKDEEGWVITYQSGLKLKIKGDEYKKITKFLTYASPIAFWQAWEYNHLLHDDSADYRNVGIKKEWLSQFAEEFREDTDNLKTAIDNLHWNFFNDIKRVSDHITSLVNQENPHDDGRLFFKKVKENKDIPKKVKRVIMFYKNNNWWKMWKLIHLSVRPDFNKIPGFEYKSSLGKIKNT